MKDKEDARCIPIDYLVKFILQHQDDEKGLAVLALSIYGMVMFPKLPGKRKWIDFFPKWKSGMGSKDS